jgi:hypothetical protein
MATALAPTHLLLRPHAVQALRQHRQRAAQPLARLQPRAAATAALVAPRLWLSSGCKALALWGRPAAAVGAGRRGAARRLRPTAHGGWVGHDAQRRAAQQQRQRQAQLRGAAAARRGGPARQQRRRRRHERLRQLLRRWHPRLRALRLWLRLSRWPARPGHSRAGHAAQRVERLREGLFAQPRAKGVRGQQRLQVGQALRHEAHAGARLAAGPSLQRPGAPLATAGAAGGGLTPAPLMRSHATGAAAAAPAAPRTWQPRSEATRALGASPAPEAAPCPSAPALAAAAGPLAAAVERRLLSAACPAPAGLDAPGCAACGSEGLSSPPAPTPAMPSVSSPGGLTAWPLRTAAAVRCACIPVADELALWPLAAAECSMSSAAATGGPSLACQTSGTCAMVASQR